ncbi:uncharacterized protein [Oscarella lobularis]
MTTTVTYRSASSTERPVLSGEHDISGWKVDSAGRWVTSVPVPGAFNITQLFVNGQRRRIAQIPNTGYLHWASPIEPCSTSRPLDYTHMFKSLLQRTACPPIDSWGFVYNATDIDPSWTNLHDVEILLFHAWTATWHNIDAVYTHNRTVQFKQESHYGAGWNEAASGRRYTVTNVYEGLDEPGEWYFNRATRQLTYMPMKGETPTTTTVAAPYLDAIVHFQNATNVNLEGIEIRFATDGPGNRQEYRATSAAITIEDSRGISIVTCSVAQAGANGISILGKSSDVQIDSCRVSDVGGDGISTATSTSNILVNNSIVDSVGFYFLQQPAGIRVQGMDNITVQYNEVAHVPYGGILVGWQPGFGPDRQPDKNPVFIIRYNHVHDHGMGILSDYGGIYVSAGVDCWQPPIKASCNMATLIHQNIIHEAHCFNYGGDGIYTDEAAGGVIVQYNLVFDVDATGVYFHCGMGNEASNNFLVGTDRLGHRGALGGCNMGGFSIQVPQRFSFVRNIVDVTSSAGHAMVGTDYTNTTFDYNLYHNTSNPLNFANEKSFEQWQASGKDVHSVIADPQFESAAKGDYYSLRSTSPAFKLGIQQMDYKLVGPHGNPFVGN